jgi:hypothetical protein
MSGSFDCYEYGVCASLQPCLYKCLIDIVIDYVRPGIAVVESICRQQRFSLAAKRLLYVAMAAIALKQSDVYLLRGRKIVLEGVGGSGKSTIANLIGKSYQPDEIAFVCDSEDMERNYPFQEVPGKHFVVFETTTYQMMYGGLFWFFENIRGRPIQIIRKHRPAISYVWTVPTLIIVNNFLPPKSTDRVVHENVIIDELFVRFQFKHALLNTRPDFLTNIGDKETWSEILQMYGNEAMDTYILGMP